MSRARTSKSLFLFMVAYAACTSSSLTRRGFTLYCKSRIVSCCRRSESRTLSRLRPCCESACLNCAMSILFSRASCSSERCSSSSPISMPRALASLATSCSSIRPVRARLRMSLRCASPAGPSGSRFSSGATRSSTSESVMGWPFTTAAIRSLISAEAARGKRQRRATSRIGMRKITDSADQGERGLVHLHHRCRAQLLQQLALGLDALVGRGPAPGLVLHFLEFAGPGCPSAEQLEDVVAVRRLHDARELVRPQREAGFVE